MEVLLCKYIEERNSFLCTTKGENFKEVEIDFFVGCALNFPKGFNDKDIVSLCKNMVGNIIVIKEDTFKNKEGVYLPLESDISSL